MTYTKQTWTNSSTSGGLSQTDEVNAERMGYIEDGIEANDTAIAGLTGADIATDGSSDVQTDIDGLVAITTTHTSQIASKADAADLADKVDIPAAGLRIMIQQYSTDIDDARITADTTSTCVVWLTTYSGEPTYFAGYDMQFLVV